MSLSAPLTSEATPVLQKIEIASSRQIPGLLIIGLPSPEVAEARERVRAAIEFSGLAFPRRRVVINLSPASIRKRGTGLDLAMALSILLDDRQRSRGKKKPGPSESGVAWGELGLDGRVKPVGQLMRALYAAWQAEAPWFILSQKERKEAERCRELLMATAHEQPGPAKDLPELVPVASLEEAWSWLCKRAFPSRRPGSRAAKNPRPTPVAAPAALATSGILPPRAAPPSGTVPDSGHLLPLPPTLARIVGVAAAGRHHLLLLGPRGTGKSHALEWLVALQPDPSATMRLHHRLIGELSAEAPALIDAPIVRRVSPQVKPAALIGSATATVLRPGEFSLAHGGLLIADELPEWARDSREIFREPLERGRVLLTRLHASLEFPARFALAANGNLCPCGGWPPQLARVEKRGTPCDCAVTVRQHYLSRLSGPLLDRIDLSFLIQAMPRVSARGAELHPLREQVARSRDLAVHSWGGVAGELSSPELSRMLERNPAWQEALARLRLSSLRSRHKVLRVALTLSAWDAAAVWERPNDPNSSVTNYPDFHGPQSRHFTEASCYRPESLGIE